MSTEDFYQKDIAFHQLPFPLGAILNICVINCYDFAGVRGRFLSFDVPVRRDYFKQDPTRAGTHGPDG